MMKSFNPFVCLQHFVHVIWVVQVKAFALITIASLRSKARDLSLLVEHMVMLFFPDVGILFFVVVLVSILLLPERLSKQKNSNCWILIKQ